jgi:hypothetical protein
MNIYFTASIVGKKSYLQNYLKIIEILNKKNHKVSSDHIIKSSENQINLQTEEQRHKFHNELKKWIMEADAMVVETSFPSISVGFEISLAINLGKPVLLLYINEGQTLLSSYNNEKLFCEKYILSTLDDIIEDFLLYVKGHADSRFTFFINSNIADYLEKISRDKKIPKSAFIRNLIEKDMISSRA